MEVHYRDEKTSLDIETFHSQTENGIRQERFAILIMAVIARTVMVLITDPDHPAGVEPQFKHVMITLASEAAILTPQCPELALRIFDELLREIARVRYYRPQTSRPSPPRVSKKPVNKWQLDKTKRLMNCSFNSIASGPDPYPMSGWIAVSGHEDGDSLLYRCFDFFLGDYILYV